MTDKERAEKFYDSEAGLWYRAEEFMDSDAERLAKEDLVLSYRVLREQILDDVVKMLNENLSAMYPNYDYRVTPEYNDISRVILGEYQ